MNEEALQQLYSLAKNEGYTDSIEDFKILMSSNEGALSNMYNVAQNEGYTDPIEDFKVLVGFGGTSTQETDPPVKKKEGLESFLVDGSLEPQESDAEAQDLQSFLTQQIEETPTQEVQPKYYEGVEAPSEAQIEAAAKADEEAEKPLPIGTMEDLDESLATAEWNKPTREKAFEYLSEEEGESLLDSQNPYPINTEAYAKFEINKFKEDPLKERPSIAEALENKFAYNLENIKPDLFEREEEDVVPMMKGIFKQYGFDFKATDKFGDGMIVSKEGVEPLYINLDMITLAGANLPAKKREADKLKKYLEKNRDVFKPEDEDKEKLILASDKIKDYYVESFQNETQSFIESSNKFNELRNKSIDEARVFKGLSLEEINADPILDEQFKSYIANVADIESQKEELIKKQKNIKEIGPQLDAVVGNYVTLRSKEGYLFPAMGNKFLRGLGKIAAGLSGKIQDAAIYAMPRSGLSEDKYKSEIIRISKEKGIELPENPDSLSLEELTTFLGGDTDDLKLFLEGVYKAVVPKGRKVDKYGNVMLAPEEVERTNFDLINDEILDTQRKGIKYFDSYDDAVKGRVRSKYSTAADYADVGKGTLNLIRESIVDAIGFKETTKQWAETDRGLFVNSLLGLSESGPAIAAAIYGGPLGRLSLVSQAMDGLSEEMQNDPNFADISESEKMFIELPYGLVADKLERMGLSNLFKGGGMINKLVSKVVGKSTSKTTSKGFSDLVETEINSALAKGLIRVGAAGAAEFETGFLQEVASIGIRDIYNDIKGKKMFENPDTFVDGIMQSIEAGLEEAIGGGLLGAPRAVKSAMSDRTIMRSDDFNSFQLFEEREDLKSIYVTKLKAKVASGLMTKKGAEAELSALNEGIGILKSNNEFFKGDASAESKSEAFTILNRKKQLEQEIEGADPKLATPQIEELANINERLVELSKTKEDAIQEPSTETVDAQESAEGRPTMGETVPGTGTITEPTEVEADKAKVEEKVEIIETFFEGEPSEDVNKVSGNLSINRIGEDTQKKSRFRNRVAAVAVKAAKSISKIIPETKIILHESNDEYLKYAKAGEGRAEYNPVQDIIHVNLSNATISTLPHEVFHAVFLNKVKTDEAAQKIAKKMVDSVRKTLPDNNELAIAIDKFAALYTGKQEQFQDEERISELIGLLASKEFGYSTLSKPAKNSIIEFFKNLANRFGIKLGTDFGKTDESVIDLINTIAKKTVEGEVIEPSEIRAIEELDQEQGEEGEVGTLRIPQQKIEVIESPKVESDPRPWVRSLVQDIDINELEGRNFVTNMYDYTNAGLTELGNGYSINLLGGRNYVPIIMNKTGRKLGDVSNLAAFNTKSQAEGFIRNATEGKADLFAPHSGTLDGSWQFQQHIFEELVNLVLDEKILSKQKLIDAFNSGLQSKEGKSALKKFNNKNNSILKNLNIFKGDPKALVTLLDIENNYSPDLRKILNQKIASDKTFQKAIGVKNLTEFHNKMTDPLNKGVVGGEIMSFVEFDPTTFEIAKTNPKDVDHHPSFGWVVKAKIKKIMQPSKFFKSYDVTDTYTKYNTNETVVSRKADENFAKSNVISSAGAIPKVAKVTRQSRQQRTERLAPNGKQSNLTDVQYDTVRTPAFKKWFGNWETDPENASKVVDENGEPTVVYHGSPSSDIDVFDRQRANEMASGIKEFGTYFATNKKLAELYKQGDGRVYPIFLNIRDMVTFDANGETNIEAWNNLKVKASYKTATNRDAMEFLSPVISKEKGLDGFGVEPVNGIKAENIIDIFIGLGSKQSENYIKAKKDYLGDVYLLFDGQPENAKLADGTNTTFKPESPSIRQQTIETQRVIKEVDGIIEKSKQRGRKFSEIPKNVLSYLQGTKLYENATDIQREQLFRDVRKKLGIKEKAAPSVKKILGVDPSKKVTMSQKQLVVQRIRDINKGAKDALRAFKSASNQVAKDVKEMVKSGNISTKQSAAIIKKFANVNMLKEKSIENFVEYMGRVFRDANYAENIAKANKLRKNAKKNIKRKIGLASAVSGDLQRIFAINPNLIPESVFNKYMELASEFGERKTVLNLSEISETAKVVKDILDAVDAELSKIPELQDILESFENKVVDEKTGQLDYAKTIDKMKTEGVISKADADIMDTYKSEIQPKKVKEVKSEEEIEAERQETIKSISEAPALKVSELSSEYERQQGDKFNFLINSVDALDGLSLQELKQVEALIDNINNGYFPHLAQVMVEKMAANLKSNTMVDAIGNAKMLPLSKRIGAFKSMFTKKGAVLEMIRRNPLYYIDQLFGDFYGKPLYESLFEDTAKAIEQYEVAFKKVSSKIDKAEDAVYKSFKNNGNKTLMSKFKQMVYMIQLEYDSNLGNPEVNQAKAFIKKNIESIKDQNLEVYGASDAEMLQEILDNFTNKETGEIDAELLYKSFNKAEKASIKTIQEVNAELGPIAEQTAAIVRGESIIPRNNYVHLNTINKEGFDAIKFNAEQHRESLQPSTKAKSLIERTGAISALNFDVYKSATKGAKGVLLDFYMTEPVRTSKRTLNSTEKKLNESGDYNQEKRDIFNGIRKGWEESIDNQFNKAYQKSVFADRVLDWINRNGYRAILASAPRFIAELSSNTAFAMIASPKEFTSGAKIGVGFLNSDAAPEAMKNLKSTNVTRIYPNGDMSGRMIDTNLMSGEGAKKAKSAKDRYTNKVDQVWSMTGSKWVKGVGSLADLLISTPDKIIMRPMWFGTFSVEFEKLTGQKPNLDKIAENDADYMSQYKEQLKESTKKADEASVMAGAASNPFMGTLRGVTKPDASAMAKMYNRFNNFMTTFLVYEYVTARTGVMNAIGRGNLSKKKGAALLGATASRMVGYTLMSSIMSDLFFGEEEEDEKDFDQQLGQAIASSVFSMGLGRDFGNATKAVINQLITEPVNKEFLTGLRNGDYNVYKDGLSYKIVPEGKMGRGVDFYDVMVNLTGPYSPLLKSARFATSAFTKPDAKTEETQSKYDKEKNLAMLEVLGHLGVIPFYKDLRTLTRKQLYKDMNNMSKAKDDSVSTTPGYFRRSTKKKRRSRKRSSGKRRAFID